MCDITVFARLVLRLTGAESIAAHARATKTTADGDKDKDPRAYVPAPPGVNNASTLLGQQCELLSAHIMHVCKSLARRTVRIRAASIERQNKLNAQTQSPSAPAAAPAAAKVDGEKSSTEKGSAEADEKGKDKEEKPSTQSAVEAESKTSGAGEQGEDGAIVLHDLYYDQVCELVLVVLETEGVDNEQLP